MRTVQKSLHFSAKSRYPAGSVSSIGPAPRTLVELNFEEGKIRESLFETGPAILDMCSAELRLPMTPLEQEKAAVLQQTLKDYGLLT